MIGAVTCLIGFGLVREGLRPEPDEHYAQRIRRSASRLRRLGGEPRDYETSADPLAIPALTDPDAGVAPPAPYETGAWVSVIAERLCPPLAAAACLRRARCGCDDASEEDCRTREARECEYWIDERYRHLPDYTTLVEENFDGCIRDATEALDCRSVRNPSRCSDLLEWPCSDCDLPSEAGEALGVDGARCSETAACRFGRVCIDGRCVARCWSDQPCEPTEMCIEGSCQRLLQSNESCVYTSDCAVGLRCLDGRCARMMSCDLDPWDSCGNDQRCVGTDFYECQPNPGIAPCQSHYDCPVGMMCDVTRCVPAPGPGRPCGGRCAVGSDCEWTEGGYQRCVEMPEPELGDPCRPSGDVDRCGSRLICGPDNLCAEPAPLGASCELERCAPTARCDHRLLNGHCEFNMCNQPTLYVETSD